MQANLKPIDGETGDPLGHFNTGQTIHASPMSYAMDVTQ
jgi:hypothetical protein